MEKILSLQGIKSDLKTYLVDLTLLFFIYMIPSISHLFAFPVYYLDPMRIALVVSLMFTSRKNSLIIALTLPIFSFIISAHPQFSKSILLSAELILNLSLFFILSKSVKNIFTAFFTSVLITKIFYYLVKYVLINFSLIDDKLFSTPIYFQIGTAVLLSLILFLYSNYSMNKSDDKSNI